VRNVYESQPRSLTILRLEGRLIVVGGVGGVHYLSRPPLC
jgi:hypothetical protein